MEGLHKEVRRKLEGIFVDRIRAAQEKDPGISGAVASVMPANAEEIQLLAEITRRYSVPLTPLGAGTAAGVEEREGSILVRFDLMRRTHLPDDRPWIEAEPGARWLHMDDELHDRGWGLTVYPTSAPRATVGGWLAKDGLGVGSFEYGWLSENVLSADLVLAGGETRTVPGEELQSVMGSASDTPVVVKAKLRTRIASADKPFAVSYETAEDLIGALTDTTEAGTPLWHLAFLNPAMVRARGLGTKHLLFGAYPAERADGVREGIRRMAEDHGGSILPAAETYRVWTERFFPIAPAHPAPEAERTSAQVSQLPELLGKRQFRENNALQGTVASSKEVLILSFDAGG